MTGVGIPVWNTLERRGVERGPTVRTPVIRTPQATDLTAPVGTIMRPSLTVETADSLVRAAGLLRENGAPILPVVDENGRLQGVLTDAGLARALAEMSEPTDAVLGFIETARTIAPYASAAEALRQGEDGATRVVVDDLQRVVGLVSPVDLWPRRRMPPKPAAVGGMATPFGVYLTTGNVSAGAPWWALMTTGASMLTMLLIGEAISGAAVAHGMPEAARLYLAFGLFFGLMRLVPLSGIHGAEHQVVNAIERQETLTSEVVRRMPLVHPRCGTNVMVGLSIFLAVFTIEWTPDVAIRALPALVLGAAFAMPLGSLVQRFVTTKRPTAAQLASAVKAGEALLLLDASARLSRPSPLRRIWSMGLLQVMAGSTAMAAFLTVLKAVTGAAWLPDVSR